jgi:hypothetical protein
VSETERPGMVGAVVGEQDVSSGGGENDESVPVLSSSVRCAISGVDSGRWVGSAGSSVGVLLPDSLVDSVDCAVLSGDDIL